MNSNKFYRKNADGYAVIFNEDGTSCTRLPGSWPVDSILSGDYEHSHGIVLTVEDAESSGISEE